MFEIKLNYVYFSLNHAYLLKSNSTDSLHKIKLLLISRKC
jgi:hypothetical protein